jgi:hypothetical protein
MTYATDGTIGVNLTQTVAGTGTSYNEGDQWPLGKIVTGIDGGRYMRVHASAAITQYQAVGVDENYEAAPLSKTMADDGWMIGFAQVAASDNDFFWLAMTGSNIKCKTLTDCAADVALYTSGTAGSLDDDSSSQTKIDGVVAVSAATSATATNVEVIATYPRASTF